MLTVKEAVKKAFEIVLLIASDCLVITDDLRFCSSLEHAGIAALNFNHVRTLRWE